MCMVLWYVYSFIDLHEYLSFNSKSRQVLTTIETLGIIYIWDYFVCNNSLNFQSTIFQLCLDGPSSTKLQVIVSQCPSIKRRERV